MKIEVTVCNTCQRPDRPTRKYEIKSEGRLVEVDLCDEHGEPIEELLPAVASVPAKAAKRPAKKAARTPQKAAGAPGRGRAQKVMTIEEIEAGKAAGKL